MTMSGADLLRIPLEQLLEKYQPTRCAHCGVTIHETTTGCRTIGTDCVCSDCYFKDMSDELEAHPISVRRMRRGG